MGVKNYINRQIAIYNCRRKPMEQWTWDELKLIGKVSDQGLRDIIAMGDRLLKVKRERYDKREGK